MSDIQIANVGQIKTYIENSPTSKLGKWTWIKNPKACAEHAYSEDFSVRLGKGVLAIIITISTLFLGLCLSDVRNLWRDSLIGRVDRFTCSKGLESALEKAVNKINGIALPNRGDLQKKKTDSKSQVKSKEAQPLDEENLIKRKKTKRGRRPDLNPLPNTTTKSFQDHINNIGNREKATIFNMALENLQNLNQKYGVSRELEAVQPSFYPSDSHDIQKLYTHSFGGSTFDLVPQFYTFQEQSATCEAYVDPSNVFLGGAGFDEHGYVLEEELVSECPNFAKYISLHLKNRWCTIRTRGTNDEYNAARGQTPQKKKDVLEKAGGATATPIYFGNIIRTVDASGCYNKPDHTKVKILREEQHFNLLAMTAPKITNKKDLREQTSLAVVKDLFETSVKGAHLAKQQKVEYIHTCALGCGAFGNNILVSMLVQDLAFWYVGIDGSFHYENTPNNASALAKGTMQVRNSLKVPIINANGVVDYDNISKVLYDALTSS